MASHALRLFDIYHIYHRGVCVCVCVCRIHPRAYTCVSVIWLHPVFSSLQLYLRTLPSPSSCFCLLSGVVFFKPFPLSERLFSQFLTCRAYFHSSDLTSNVTCLENPFLNPRTSDCLSALNPPLHSTLWCWGWNSANDISFFFFASWLPVRFNNRLH